jgi:transposase
LKLQHQSETSEGELINEITTVGVDLAKEVIVVCAGDAEGRTVFFRQFSFAGFAEWAANLPPCLIGMEACSSAHHWARFLTQHGHTPKLMAAELVEPYRLSRGAKNDRNDAQAILSAVRQPNMCFVTVKSIDQQAMLAWHRSRAGYLEERTALLNRTRGMLAEFGLWLGRSSAVLLRQLPRLAPDERLPARFRPILTHVIEHLRQIDARIDECDAQIREHARHSEQAKRLQAVLGIGHITASALVATIANPRDFRNGRQLSALVRPGAPPAQLRWQSTPRCHHQTRRFLPARPAHPRRTLHDASRPQTRAAAPFPARTLDRRAARSRRLSQDAGGDRQQAPAHRLGHPRSQRALRSQRLAPPSTRGIMRLS